MVTNLSIVKFRYYMHITIHRSTLASVLKSSIYNTCTWSLHFAYKGFVYIEHIKHMCMMLTKARERSLIGAHELDLNSRTSDIVAPW